MDDRVSVTYIDSLTGLEDERLMDVLAAIGRRISELRDEVTQIENRAVTVDMIEEAQTQSNIIGGMIDNLEERVSDLDDLSHLDELVEIKILADIITDRYNQIIELLPTRIAKRIHQIDTTLFNT